MTTTDRILALTALAAFVVFLGFMAIWVKEVDLIIVLAAGAILAGYDFMRSLLARRNGNGQGH